VLKFKRGFNWVLATSIGGGFVSLAHAQEPLLGQNATEQIQRSLPPVVSVTEIRGAKLEGLEQDPPESQTPFRDDPSYLGAEEPKSLQPPGAP